MSIFDHVESAVRSYCRNWPTVFNRGQGSWIYDEGGRGYLDFFAGAGALNYGHNNSALKQGLLDYVTSDGIAHALDMSTIAKRDLLDTFVHLILKPRRLDYRIQFPSPTGASSVESALRLARKATGRTAVLGFANSFHGVTLGALLVSDSRLSRMDSTTPVSGRTPLPYNTHFGDNPDLSVVERRFDVSAVGQERPAAVIVETVQGEGGVNVASVQWLQALSRLCSDFGVVLIVDDVQAGCGRTGSFFSFENAGIVPDIVCLSKSISGYGLPLALTLIRPDLDVWEPGEHSGTFRGNNHAFITATKAIETYWSDNILEKQTVSKGESVRRELASLAAAYPHLSLGVRGAGLINGLSFLDGKQARSVCFAAFERGLLVETAGRQGEVVKLMPPLTTTDDELDTGLELLKASIEESVHESEGL